MTTAVCGVEYKLVAGETCVLPFEPAHPVHRSARNYYWPDAPVEIPSQVPRNPQARDEKLLDMAQGAKKATRAPEPERPQPPKPMKAPVGNQYPDTSRWAAEKVSKTLRNTQLPAVAWILSVVEDWGIGEQNTAYWYNQYLLPIIDHVGGKPPKELHNEMGSRLQAMRGYGTNPVHGLPWAEYIQNREPCGPNEKMSGIKDRRGEKAIARINVNGNPSLVQRLTDAPEVLEAVQKTEQKLIDKYGENAVEEMKREIRRGEGMPG